LIGLFHRSCTLFLSKSGANMLTETVRREICSSAAKATGPKRKTG
jgi:hypothetical protein